MPLFHTGQVEGLRPPRRDWFQPSQAGDALDHVHPFSPDPFSERPMGRYLLMWRKPLSCQGLLYSE